MKYFAENIRFLREKENMTQTQFGSLFGLSGSRVSNWEQGTRTPKLEVLIKICERYNITADSLANTDLSRNDNELFSKEEIELINNFRKLSDKKKMLIISTVETMLED